MSYGVAALLHDELHGLDRDLFKIYDAKDACMILTLAMLRIERPGIPMSRCNQQYLKSFISVYYPGLPLSENTISKFLSKLGQDAGKMSAFATSRLSSVCKDHHILVDGTLKMRVRQHALDLGGEDELAVLRRGIIHGLDAEHIAA